MNKLLSGNMNNVQPFKIWIKSSQVKYEWTPTRYNMNKLLPGKEWIETVNYFDFTNAPWLELAALNTTPEKLPPKNFYFKLNIISNYFITISFIVFIFFFLICHFYFSTCIRVYVRFFSLFFCFFASLFILVCVYLYTYV